MRSERPGLLEGPLERRKASDPPVRPRPLSSVDSKVQAGRVHYRAESTWPLIDGRRRSCTVHPERLQKCSVDSRTGPKFSTTSHVNLPMTLDDTRPRLQNRVLVPRSTVPIHRLLTPSLRPARSSAAYARLSQGDRSPLANRRWPRLPAALPLTGARPGPSRQVPVRGGGVGIQAEGRIGPPVTESRGAGEVSVGGPPVGSNRKGPASPGLAPRALASCQAYDGACGRSPE